MNLEQRLIWDGGLSPEEILVDQRVEEVSTQKHVGRGEQGLREHGFDIKLKFIDGRKMVYNC